MGSARANVAGAILNFADDQIRSRLRLVTVNLAIPHNAGRTRWRLKRSDIARRCDIGADHAKLGRAQRIVPRDTNRYWSGVRPDQVWRDTYDRRFWWLRLQLDREGHG